MKDKNNICQMCGANVELTKHQKYAIINKIATCRPIVFFKSSV